MLMGLLVERVKMVLGLCVELGVRALSGTIMVAGSKVFSKFLGSCNSYNTKLWEFMKN